MDTCRSCNQPLPPGYNLGLICSSCVDALRPTATSSAPTFLKFDVNKPMYSLIDPYAYEDLAKVMTFGAVKYAPDNWKLGTIERYISALERHLAEVKKAVADNNSDLLLDSDSGLQHGAGLMFNAQAIHYFIRKQLHHKGS